MAPAEDVRSFSGWDFPGLQAFLPRAEIKSLPNMQVCGAGFPLSLGLSFLSWAPEILNIIEDVLLQTELERLEAFHIVEGGQLLP